MLEPISLGQGRTHCPGLAADERGVVMGRRLGLFFQDIARAVGFFRSYSRDVNLDEILASLEIRESVSELGGREIMVRFEVSSSYAADRAAQAARMHRGRVFTGTERHYISYRDRRSPLGYDLGGTDEVVQDPGDLVLYADAGPDRRKLARTIAIKDLILGLSPRPLTESERANEQYEAIVIRTEVGVSEELSRYLWYRQVRATVRQAVSAKKSLFTGKHREVQLVRCENLPTHMARLLAQTPGMDVFIPVQPHLLVQWGYRHPIALESVGSAFDEDETILFFGPPSKIERLSADEDAVDIKDLVDVKMHGPSGVIAAPEQSEASPVEALNVELKLARLPGAGAATQALLIDLDRLSWFMKLIYMLPAAVLRAYEGAVTNEYIIVVNRRGVHGIPFGDAMTELYPQVFVPVGMQLLPRVDYDLLREHLQIRPDQNFYFFPEEKPAFAIAHDQFRPLARAVVADDRARQSMVELRSRDIAEELGRSTVSHRSQGVFSLWRGTKIESLEDAKRLDAAVPTKALPPASPPPETPQAPPQEPPAVQAAPPPGADE